MAINAQRIQLNELADRSDVSHGVKVPAHAHLVYCSGQIPAEGNGTTLLQGTIEEKTELVLRNLEKVLRAGNSSLEQLVKVNIFITSFDFFDEMNSAYNRIIPNPKPVRTCVQVAGLPFGADLEIEMTGWSET